MLTHPCFSSLREDQEGREEGQIRKEIDETINFLKGCGMASDECLRFYRGTPTCFAVIASNAMLLNPYPYQIEAFRSFCIEVRRLPQNLCPGCTLGSKEPVRSIPPQIDIQRFAESFHAMQDSEGEKDYDYSMDIGPDIYGQFYWFHYLLPWFSRQAVTFKEFDDVCRGCDYLNRGYNKEECKLRQGADKNKDQ